MDIDAFHDGQGVVLEVEAGRAWNGNAVYRDLVRASLLLDARFLALVVPVGYAPQYGQTTDTRVRLHRRTPARHLRKPTTQAAIRRHTPDRILTHRQKFVRANSLETLSSGSAVPRRSFWVIRAVRLHWSMPWE